jgi:hypothetical protein
MRSYATSAQVPSASTLAFGQRVSTLAERRRRGEVSCAECSRWDIQHFIRSFFLMINNARLKTGCDKRIPCTPCLVRCFP